MKLTKAEKAKKLINLHHTNITTLQLTTWSMLIETDHKNSIYRRCMFYVIRLRNLSTDPIGNILNWDICMPTNRVFRHRLHFTVTVRISIYKYSFLKCISWNLFHIYIKLNQPGNSIFFRNWKTEKTTQIWTPTAHRRKRRKSNTF